MDAFEAISVPEPSSAVGQRYFTVTQANRALVLVRRIVTDVVRDYRRLRAFQNAYETCENKGNLPLAEQARHSYVGVFNHLSELRGELEEIGCELKDYEQGLVDFPAVLEGREVLLCWKLGEDAVAFWHELNAGYAGRRPLTREI
jgi:hypothetical protein